MNKATVLTFFLSFSISAVTVNCNKHFGKVAKINSFLTLFLMVISRTVGSDFSPPSGIKTCTSTSSLRKEALYEMDVLDERRPRLLVSMENSSSSSLCSGEDDPSLMV